MKEKILTAVIPAQAGIYLTTEYLDSGLRRNDGYFSKYAVVSSVEYDPCSSAEKLLWTVVGACWNLVAIQITNAGFRIYAALVPVVWVNDGY